MSVRWKGEATVLQILSGVSTFALQFNSKNTLSSLCGSELGVVTLGGFCVPNRRGNRGVHPNLELEADGHSAYMHTPGSWRLKWLVDAPRLGVGAGSKKWPCQGHRGTVSVS